jgi:hypothetical protein
VRGLATESIGRGKISFELLEAWALPPPNSPPTGLSYSDAQVLSWLQTHQGEILAAERDWHIDRRAIAGAIAWEALVNVRKSHIGRAGRSAGPGKVHYSTEFAWGEGNPLAKQVEDQGYLPQVTMAKRRHLLRSPVGATRYIGAIMCAFADVASRYGFTNTRCDPRLILTNPYQGDDLTSWTALLAKKKPGDTLEPGNSMCLWLQDPFRIRFLEAGVGKPSSSICQPAYIGPSGHVAPGQR